MARPEKHKIDPKLDELSQRNERQRRRFKARQPKAISDVVAQLFAKRGYAARRTSEQLTAVWQNVAGEPLAKFSQAIGIRRGKLEVLVANSLMLQEIHFERERIISALADALPEARISDLQLRIGTLPT